MNEPWNIKSSDERLENTLKTFIIFCEDIHHEPLYLKSYEQFFEVKINVIGNQKQRKTNLNNTIRECKERGLITFSSNSYKIQDGVTEHIWCVYDRDLEFEDLALISDDNNVDFDTAIQTAQSIGIKVAWSNDVFELWVLLHFEIVPFTKPLHRTYIYDRLTEIFKTIVPRSPELDAITSQPTFNYKTNLKRRERYINFVKPLLHQKRDIAIVNAKILEAQFSLDKPYHLRNPCTMIHHLVHEIIS